MSTQLTALYPAAAVNQSGHLQVTKVHRVYWESCGNANGKPVVFVHGGPGGGTSTETRRFFNPDTTSFNLTSGDVERARHMLA